MESIETAIRPLHIHAIEFGQLQEVGASVKGVSPESVGFKIVKEVKGGASFVREMQGRGDQIVRGCQDVVAELALEEGEVLQVRVTVRENVVEDNEREEFLDLNRICFAVLFQNAGTSDCPPPTAFAPRGCNPGSGCRPALTCIGAFTPPSLP